MRLTVQRKWPDGDIITAEIEAESSYPDVMAEAKRAVLDMFAEAMGVTLAAVDE